MRAIICTAYGPPDVLQLTSVEKPLPGDNDVLIRIHASTVTMGDCELRGLTLPLWTRIPMRLFMGFRKPKRFTPGMELAGVIETVGKNVVSYKAGDCVFGSSGMRMGANAEYKVLKDTSPMGIKPPNVSFEDVATIPVGGINALHFLRKAKIKTGQKVLIIGAGGSIGTYGVQLAKLFGAEVTAVDSTHKLEVMRAIGADHVIDYTKEDFTKNGVQYDVILDTVYTSSFSGCVNALTEEGCYLMANPGPRRMIKSLFAERNSKKKVIFEFAAEKTVDMNYLAELISTGKIKPVIDKRYPLEKVIDAHHYVEQGNKVGCLIIAVTDAATKS
jgi:NADPH:quinone reductase-like Zn-dependent oxidoreductase